MINDEVLAKLEEDVRLWGFSTGTIKGYLIYTKLFMRYFSDRPIADLNEHDIFYSSPTQTCRGKDGTIGNRSFVLWTNTK